ncbi:hypothetical protein [Nonlabens antarcticus]|uniref:hypothetical protein n=1 Tax=Nonlabens antarcticus TaxID=392714 RepID=UPI001891A050|nr:hypothetical protein [Nonlabens antarcticus]
MIDLTKASIMQALEANNLELFSTHKKLSIPIIYRMSRKMKAGVRFDDIKVCENLLIDGHHRYVSSILAGKTLGRVKSSKTSATRVWQWSEVNFVKEEWDTPEKIYSLNEDDAEFNNISLEKLIEITS